jgi:hypothetical protein
MSGFASLVSGVWHFSRNPQKPAEEYKKYSTLIDYDFYDWFMINTKIHSHRFTD